MPKGRWFEEDRVPFLKAMSSLFKYSENLSARSVASSNRESDVNTLMSRIVNQLYTYDDLNLPWRTPEDWDNSLDLIEGGQSCRRSKSILSRVDWGIFIIKCEELLNYRLDTDD